MTIFIAQFLLRRLQSPHAIPQPSQMFTTGHSPYHHQLASVRLSPRRTKMLKQS
jgi:hypothetical protein